MGTVSEVDDAIDTQGSNVLDVCKLLIASWKELTSEDVEISDLTGGITNLLLKVSPKKSTGLAPVVVRIYGDCTELLIDRAREMKVLAQLNSAGFGAKVLGGFKNGRIEEFLNCYTLNSDDVSKPVLLKRIAGALFDFHMVKVDEEVKPNLFSCTRHMLNLAKELSFDDPVKKEAYQAIDLEKLDEEVSEMEKICAASSSPVVYSHNDLLPGNILLLKDEDSEKINEESSPMNFIDFEYGSYSYRGFDLGNHFNEYCGFDCDWSLYPEYETQRLFATAYLSKGLKHGESVSEAAVERVLAEADLFSMMSNIQWGVWALIQAKYARIEFDYLTYANNRISRYLNQKKAVLEKVKPVLF